MALVWSNYYNFVKVEYIDSGIQGRITTADGDVSTYKTSLGTIGGTFTTVLTNLDTTASSVTDPQYGLIAGFNCRIFGEDISLIINTLCARFFNVFYFLRIALGIGSFGILFTMCCAVCAGTRHYNQGERKDKLVPTDNDGTMGNLSNKM